MKPVEVKSSTYFDSTKENYEKYRKFKIALYRKKWLHSRLVPKSICD